MANSQNGWPASPSKGAIGIVDAKVPGTNINFPQGVKGGDVETVLMYVAHEFHENVEALRDGWCWGYNYRQIEGSTQLSNHASGTAIDLNAPNHPMGKSGTFSDKKVGEIRKILSFCEGVVRWGGDYKTRKDEMHFEINDDAAAVKRIANKIRRLGDDEGTGDSIWDKPLAVDGRLGRHTTLAWQRQLDVPMTGVMDEATITAVQKRLKATVDRNLVVDGKGIKQDGQYYKTVAALQRYLKSPVDGRMSTPVSQVVMALQRRLKENRF